MNRNKLIFKNTTICTRRELTDNDLTRTSSLTITPHETPKVGSSR